MWCDGVSMSLLIWARWARCEIRDEVVPRDTCSEKQWNFVSQLASRGYN